MGEVGDDDVGAAAGGPDLLGHLVELGLRARRDDHVRAGFREGQCHRGAESAARAGDDGDLVVEPKSVENHVRLSFSPGDTVARASTFSSESA